MAEWSKAVRSGRILSWRGFESHWMHFLLFSCVGFFFQVLYWKEISPLSLSSEIARYIHFTVLLFIASIGRRSIPFLSQTMSLCLWLWSCCVWWCGGLLPWTWTTSTSVFLPNNCNWEIETAEMEHQLLNVIIKKFSFVFLGPFAPCISPSWPCIGCLGLIELVVLVWHFESYRLLSMYYVKCWCTWYCWNI